MRYNHQDMLGSKASIMRALCANLSSNPWIVRRWHGSILNQHRLSGHRSVRLCLALLENFIFSFHIKMQIIMNLACDPLVEPWLSGLWCHDEKDRNFIPGGPGNLWNPVAQKAPVSVPLTELPEKCHQNRKISLCYVSHLVHIILSWFCDQKEPWRLFQHNLFIIQMSLDLQRVKSF